MAMIPNLYIDFSDDEQSEAYSGTFSPLFATQPPGLVENSLDNDFNLSDLSEEEQSKCVLSNKHL